MKHTSIFHNMVIIKTLYFTFVRSILQYASIILMPYYTITIIRIERVQNRFLHFAARQLNLPIDIYTHDYNKLGITLNILLLESRLCFLT